MVSIPRSRKTPPEALDTIKRNVQESMRTQVENFILGKIDSGEWPAGGKIPSERELSMALDISRTTVRNAIQELTSRGLFDRRIGQGTFVRERDVGLSEPRASKGLLGYVICKERSARKPISAEAFYFDVFAGIEEETARSGRHLAFTYLDEGNADEIAAFDGFLQKVDGLVLEEASGSALLDRVAANGAPAVLIAPTVAHERLDVVTMDLAEGVRKAVRYLRGLGHGRIGIVNGPLRLESARIRFAAFKEEMGEAFDEALVEGGEGWTAEAGFAAAARLVERGAGLTALFCANDLLAIGALSALAAKGLRVPAELSVVGFDDSELARHASPPLTTMRIYSRDMARSAARRVLERIETPGLPPIKLEFPIDIVVRNSAKEV